MALLLTLPELSPASGVTIYTRRRIVTGGGGNGNCRFQNVVCRSFCAYEKVADREAIIVRVSDPIRNAAFNPILSVPVLYVSSASPPPPSLSQQLQQMDGGDDKKDYYVNLGNAIRTLREDYPIIFYKEPGFNIYRDDIVFKDPLNTFVGIDNYKQIFSALRFIGPVLFKALWIDIVSVWQPVENTIIIRWTVHGIRRVPWESHGRFDAISVYKLDRKGKIFEHRVNNIARNPPMRFKIVAVEELIQSLGSSSTPKPTYFETSLSGATFNRGFNRALGSLLAGIFAIAMMQVSMDCGRIAEPYIIALSIFFVGAITSFMKLYPSLVPYEYGFRVILFTYCLIIISGYRMGNPIKTAMDRMYSIAIGGIVAVLVNSLVFPIWAGEQLHHELVGSFNAVADSLQECVKKYLDDDGSTHPEFSKTIMDDFTDEPAFRKCRATLNSSATFEAVANSAKWEPPHGRFRHFFYPWSEYIKVGAVLRHCAYEVMAMHGCLHSEIQAPYNLRCAFQPEILDATNQAAELLRSLGKDINNMKRSLQTNLLKQVHSSTERLQRSIDIHSYLLTSSHEIQDCAKPPNTIIFKFRDIFSQVDESGSTNKNPNSRDAKPVCGDSYHETMRKQQRRLYSWPSREVDDHEDVRGDTEMLHKMHTFESTAALSLATFTSLLIEFVARLDHLVDATDLLAKMAKFKEDSFISLMNVLHALQSPKSITRASPAIRINLHTSKVTFHILRVAFYISIMTSHILKRGGPKGDNPVTHLWELLQTLRYPNCLLEMFRLSLKCRSFRE